MAHASGYRMWNVFRLNDVCALCCAVPVEMPLPAFLTSGRWSFRDHGTDDGLPWARLDSYPARHGVHVNGFYLFMPMTADGNA